LILQCDRLGSGTPHRVEHRLDILLVDHQIVRSGIPREPAVGVTLGVSERHDEAGTAYRIKSGLGRKRPNPILHRRQSGTSQRTMGGVDLR
jgi:hypothetical protein